MIAAALIYCALMALFSPMVIRCRGNVARHRPILWRPEKGGIARDGSIISGTAVERPEIDPLAPPQGDPRFW